MNGSAATYHMDAPVTWEAFKTWPEDIQAEYIERLRDRYQVNGTHIANMMHTTPAALASWRHGHGVEFGRRGPKKPGPEWAEFCARPYQWDGKPAEREQSPSRCAAAELGSVARQAARRGAPFRQGSQSGNGEAEPGQTPADPATPAPEAALRAALKAAYGAPGGPPSPEPIRAKEAIKPTAGEIQQLLDLLPALRAAGAKIRIEVEL